MSTSTSSGTNEPVPAQGCTVTLRLPLSTQPSMPSSMPPPNLPTNVLPRAAPSMSSTSAPRCPL